MIEAADYEDNVMTTVLLNKETGLPLTRCITILWKHIVWDSTVEPVSAQLLIPLEHTSGSTHDRRIPLSGFGAKELYRRYMLAQTRTPKQALAQTPIVSVDEHIPTVKAVSEKCRTLLLKAGMDTGSLISDRTQQYGVGVRLFIRNYKYRLQYICGIRDIGTLRYLTLESLAGCVTDDHYRSYTDPDGQYHLRALVNRDSRFNTLLARAVEVRDNGDGTLTTILPPEDSKHLNSGCFEYILQPGESVTVGANYGIQQGAVTATPVPERSPRSDHKAPVSSDEIPEQLSLF